jgi:hypothetical protein
MGQLGVSFAFMFCFLQGGGGDKQQMRVTDHKIAHNVSAQILQGSPLCAQQPAAPVG